MGKFLATGCFALALIFMGGVNAGFAADVFTVGNIQVDATADTAAQAKDIAIANGGRNALRRLLRRLTLQEDWSFLPEVNTRERTEMIAGFEVANEKSSATRYLAKITFRFKPKAVRELLRTAFVGFSETQRKAVAVVPVYETAEGTFLWEGENPWRDAWAQSDLNHSLTPHVLPLGDLTDLTNVTVQRAVALDTDALLDLAERYSAEQALVAIARADEMGRALSVRLTTVGGEVPQSIGRIYESEEDNQIPLLAQTAIGELTSELAEEWKRETLITYGETQSIVASIPYGALSEWLTIRSRLSEIPTIMQVDVRTISIDGALATITFVGGPQKLALALSQRDLSLMSGGAGYWNITLTRVAGQSNDLGEFDAFTPEDASSDADDMEP